MVVTKAVEGGNRLGSVFFPIIVHKGKALIQKSMLETVLINGQGQLSSSGRNSPMVGCHHNDIQDTLHWPVILSLARKILAICPKGLKSSWQEWFKNRSQYFASRSSGTDTEFCIPDHLVQAAVMVKIRTFKLNPDLFWTTFWTFPDL